MKTVRIVEFENPLTIAINGRKGEGIVVKPEDPGASASSEENDPLLYDAAE